MLNKFKNIIKSYIYPPKKYHWYSVRYIYKARGGTILELVGEVGLAKQKNILDKRYIKKKIQPLHKIVFTKPYLDNGGLSVQIVGYLGFFSE